MSARSGLVGKKSSWPYLGPYRVILSWTEKSKKCQNVVDVCLFSQCGPLLPSTHGGGIVLGWSWIGYLEWGLTVHNIAMQALPVAISPLFLIFLQECSVLCRLQFHSSRVIGHAYCLVNQILAAASLETIKWVPHGSHVAETTTLPTYKPTRSAKQQQLLQVGIWEFFGRRRRLEIWEPGNLGFSEFGDLGTWKSRIVEIWRPGNSKVWDPTNQKKSLKNQIRSAQNVGKVWISRNKNPPSPIWTISSNMARNKYKNM